MKSPLAGTATGKPAKLLVAIDDDPFYLNLYSHLGKRLFEAIITFSSARLAEADTLEAADVLLLDLAMPGTDGMHFLTELLPAASKPDLHLIICSGLDRHIVEIARRTAQLVGVERVSVLPKPFTATEFQQTVLADDSEAPAAAGRSSASAAASVPELRTALQLGHLVPHWQPQVNTQNGRVSGLEILSRWYHPVRGMLMPLHFLDAMESDEFALEFTLGLLAKALESLRRWERHTAYEGRISLNTPVPAAMDPSFAEQIMDLLELWDFPPRRLVLELTEHAAPKRDSQLLAGLARLVMGGLELSIDDFGTGHASLDRLGTEIFREIKIDRSFISLLDTSDMVRAMTEDIIRAAKDKGMRIVAEGVSSADAAAALHSMGCTELQGSHFTMPLHEDELVEWLVAHDAK